MSGVKKDFAMGDAHSGMDTVIDLGLKFPDVTEDPHYGFRALKLHGRMLACTPVNKSAESNSAVVAMGFEQRATLLKRNPLVYYLTDHYASYPTMLIRLSRISRAELERTLRKAWVFVSSESKVPRSSRKAKLKSARALSLKSKSRGG
jgi:hypothetical protein